MELLVSPQPSRYGRVLFGGLLEAMTRVMGTAKGYLFHHGPRVALMSRELSRDFGLPARDQAEVFFAAVLGDIGMIGLVEEAWEQPVPTLPPMARAQVEEHPERSAQAVSALPYMERVTDFVRHHHEWWDGSGYPSALVGDEIPLGSQIIRISDTVSALQQERPHRPARSVNEIRMTVAGSLGAEFGPEVGRRFLRILDRGGFPTFNPGLFMQAHHQAVQDLLPDDVSTVSVEALLEVLGGLIDAKDPYTGGHSRRVATLAARTAQILDLDREVEGRARAAGHLHDLGKLSVPLRILWKPTRLDGGEVGQIRAHTTSGAAILESIPALRHLAAGARYHHERWDGRGYPEGLSGDHIPIIPRILCVCDAYDAMTSGRAYRSARSHLEAIQEVKAGIGTHFGPRVGEAFLAIPDQVFMELQSGGAGRKVHALFPIPREQPTRRWVASD